MPTSAQSSGLARISSHSPTHRALRAFAALAVALPFFLSISSISSLPLSAEDDPAPAKTLAELRAAAKTGEAQALLDLADELAYGPEATPESTAESVAWYRRAAEKGSADGQHHLGILLWHGEGLEKNQVEAVQWFRRAADQGKASSQYWLASAYEIGQGGLPADPAEAVKWYRRAAEQGHPESQDSLGQMYAEGSGVPQDDAEAVRWFQKAADQHSPSGEHSLGEMYAAGRGVAKDEKKAFLLFQSAADKNYTVAMTSLGEAYERGRGTEKNPVCAYFWYGFAAKAGFSIGEEKRDALGSSLSATDRAEGERLIAAAEEGEMVRHPLCPGETVSVKVTNAALGDILHTLETMSGRKILVDPKVAGLGVTLTVDDVSWETALTKALESQGYAWKREGEAIRVVKRAKAKP